MLAGIEREFAGRPVVVIGVHSPKFPREGDAEAVRDAVRRYDVSHPVLVDTAHAVWMEYGVSAWPTLVVVDPQGYIHAAGAGEPEPRVLSKITSDLLEEHGARGTLDESPLPLEPEPEVGALLSYPSKVEVSSEVVAVTDTGHHRILLCRLDGDVLRVEKAIGGPEAGFADGPPEAARLSHPYGTALVDGSLFIAEAGNHAIRRVDLESGVTETVAGTGNKGGWPLGGGAGKGTSLRSPWDLAWDEERGLLYVAMAGSHQIWAYQPGTQRIQPFAGSGREARIDGPAQSAAFAQPSGIAITGDHLWVADSEISSVREIDLSSKAVRTVCGGDLFDFGDRDGKGDEVRLQHVMGIAAAPDGSLFIADSYNHKIKRIDPATGECRTFFGGPEHLMEPEGLAVLPDGSIVVADTNRHRVVRVSGASFQVLLE